jgi:hypothetical protein
MRTYWWCVLVVFIGAGLLLPYTAAQNKNEKNKKKQEMPQNIANDKQKGKSNAADDQKHDRKPSGDHAAKRHSDDVEQGWDRRDGFEVRVFGDHNSRPPGWNRGKKTGWGNCGVPPGQAKKGECRTYRYEGRRYYYYTEDDGRMIVRRPTINVTIR